MFPTVIAQISTQIFNNNSTSAINMAKPEYSDQYAPAQISTQIFNNNSTSAINMAKPEYSDQYAPDETYEDSAGRKNTLLPFAHVICWVVHQHQHRSYLKHLPC
ncbi:hypothetical protein QE152_g35187 [Popillia japonica]|uniref:Uncharacterized protein n=1 Tax=Popillia japonica TaxID=7064 RepID=A0AAW1IG93_POPJA